MDNQERRDIRDLFTKNKFNEIEEKLSKYKNLDNKDYLAFLFFFYYCTNQYVEKDNTFNKLVDIFSGDLSELYYHLGQISHEICVNHFGGISPQDSLKYYRMALNENPNHYYSLFEIGKHYIAAEIDIEKGIETIRKVTSIDSELFSSAYNFYLYLYSNRFRAEDINKIIGELNYYTKNENPNYFLKLAECYFYSKQYDFALQNIKKITTIEPDFHMYRVKDMLYRIYKELNDFDNAYSAALEIDVITEANCLFDFKKYDKALDKFNAIINNKKNTTNIQAVNNKIGLCYYYSKRFDEAEESFKRNLTESNRLTNEKDYNESLINLSILCEKKDDFILALEYVDKAILLSFESDSKANSGMHVENLIRRAEIFSKRHISMYRDKELPDLDDDNIDEFKAENIISRIEDSFYFNSTWKVRFEKDIKTILEITDEKTKIIENLERKIELFEKSHSEKCNKKIVDILNKAFSNGVKNYNLVLKMAQVKYSLQEYVESIKYYEELIDEDPNNITYLNNIAVAYIQNGDVDTAAKYYAKAISFMKDYEQNLTIEENVVRSLLKKSETDPSIINEALQAAEDFFKKVIAASNQHSKLSSDGLFNLRNTTLYKYRPFNIYTLDGIANNYIYFADLSGLNDPLDIPLIEYSKSKEYEFQEINTSDIRICSLSQEPNHSLMWAHYADSFRGICIGYYLIKLPKNVGWNMIRYSSEQNNFSRLSRKEGLLGAGLYTKQKNWNYEKEIRLLTYKSESQKIKYDYPLKVTDDKSIEGYINEITIGYKFPKTQITILKSIVKILNTKRQKYFIPPITLYETELDMKYPFKLKKKKISTNGDF